MIIPEQILIVARRLGSLREDVVFLGGMVRGMLVTDPAVPGPRQTKDVDVIVEISSQVERAQFNEQIRARGFREDMSEDAPICRYVLKGAYQESNLPVDFMPLDHKILGVANRWYPSAFQHATLIETSVGAIRVIDAPHYIATKLESFADRGKGDFSHHDIEDVIVVVDGRPSLLDELRLAPLEVKEFVGTALGDRLEDRAFMSALPWHLPPDAIGQSRLTKLEARLRALATLAD